MLEVAGADELDDAGGSNSMGGEVAGDDYVSGADFKDELAILSNVEGAANRNG